jgi:hypothetical protein
MRLHSVETATFAPSYFLVHTKWVGNFPLYEEITEYRDKWRIHLQRMGQTRFPLQARIYSPSGRQDIEDRG